MNFSDNGLALLKKLEGSVKIKGLHVIYDDKTAKPVAQGAMLPRGATIGYGHLIKFGESFGCGIDEQTATALLREDVACAEYAVRNNINVPVSQNQYDALVILAYNIGTRNFAESTVVKYINNPHFHSKKYPNLESAWMAWNKSGGREMSGLTNRRCNEWRLFIS